MAELASQERKHCHDDEDDEQNDGDPASMLAACAICRAMVESLVSLGIVILPC
jgi:hypothetical protein